jgi:hypothetical protein
LPRFRIDSFTRWKAWVSILALRCGCERENCIVRHILLTDRSWHPGGDGWRGAGIIAMRKNQGYWLKVSSHYAILDMFPARFCGQFRIHRQWSIGSRDRPEFRSGSSTMAFGGHGFPYDHGSSIVARGLLGRQVMRCGVHCGQPAAGEADRWFMRAAQRWFMRSADTFS